MAGLMVKTYDLLLRKQNALAAGLISQNTQNLQGKRQLSKDVESWGYCMVTGPLSTIREQMRHVVVR
jgi:hypothetical protein